MLQCNFDVCHPSYAKSDVTICMRNALKHHKNHLLYLANMPSFVIFITNVHTTNYQYSRVGYCIQMLNILFKCMSQY